MVLGCSGGGKSTLANALASITGLRAVHMDLMFWKPNWVERSKPEIMQMVLNELKHDGWVFDGNHSSTHAHRLEHADMIIWVDIARWRCLFNIFLRLWKYRGRHRPSITEGCHERVEWDFLKYIWDFNKVRGPKIAKLLEQVKDSKQTVRLRNYAEMNVFIEEMKKQYGQKY